MFAQQIRRAGMALATAAFIATTLAAAIPASAAPLGPVTDHEYLVKPDVIVKAVGLNGSDNSYWTAGFTVQNKNAAATNVKLTSVCAYTSVFTNTYKDAKIVTSTVSFGPNDPPMQKTVMCPSKASSQLQLAWVGLEAKVPAGDSNTNNNYAEMVP